MKLLSHIIFEEAEEKLSNLSVIDYVLGLSYIGVKTEAGIGIAYTFRANISSGCNILNKNLKGLKALDLAKLFFSDDLLESSIGLATINSVLNNGQKDTREITERFDFKNKNVAIVGYFKPVIEKIKDIVKNLYIFELKTFPNILPPNLAKFYLPNCDIVIISGTTLINKTTEDFLCYCSDTSVKIIMGPSTPLSNELSKFSNIAGSFVKDDNILDAISKGAGMKGIKPYIEKRWLTKSNI
ncbi:hypothetical protein FHQ18_05745 [Deferribacter autotrophicus]|uniref:DUF364 domain-containing protein n=1 Tax=Deferribacter autotrophicus TaxID=500465 RepID=A0A5A8F704_9BACT|nr:DUF364 domain-containing protein [Deferribacter autotrophicus]KAA0258659.1 hypothetical protein FHQ18_05745 [Deferribacter autotrophicus]